MSFRSELHLWGAFNISLDELLYREWAHFAQTLTGVHFECSIQSPISDFLLHNASIVSE